MNLKVWNAMTREQQEQYLLIRKIELYGGER